MYIPACWHYLTYVRKKSLILYENSCIFSSFANTYYCAEYYNKFHLIESCNFKILLASKAIDSIPRISRLIINATNENENLNLDLLQYFFTECILKLINSFNTDPRINRIPAESLPSLIKVALEVCTLLNQNQFIAQKQELANKTAEEIKEAKNSAEYVNNLVIDEKRYYVTKNQLYKFGTKPVKLVNFKKEKHKCYICEQGINEPLYQEKSKWYKHIISKYTSNT